MFRETKIHVSTFSDNMMYAIRHKILSLNNV